MFHTSDALIRNVHSQVADRVGMSIVRGDVGVGETLPSEMQICEMMDVSRTVVREAISALRARGLVTTRQGAGAFVNSESQQPYAIDPDGLGSLSSVIEILELRTAVEMETAAIACERATSAQIKAIARALATFSRAIETGEPAVKEDFDFHFAIAIATNNSRFVGFLEFLGGLIIPRQSIRTFDGDAALLRRYLENVEKEHRTIFEAISAKSPRKARAAMRRHLLNGKERYRQLAAEPEK